MVTTNFVDVLDAKYLLLTTFTRDGQPKSTPIGVVRDGDRLLAVTEKASWKAKRIRNTATVTIAKCGMLGTPRSDPVDAVVHLLPSAQTRRVYRAVLKRYWYHALWRHAQTIAHGGVKTVYLAFQITAPSHSGSLG